jgi:hypothetical protein
VLCLGIATLFQPLGGQEKTVSDRWTRETVYSGMAAMARGSEVSRLLEEIEQILAGVPSTGEGEN